MSKHVALLVKPNLDIKIMNVNSDNLDYILRLDISIEECDFSLFNTYAPCVPVNFLNKLSNKIH